MNETVEWVHWCKDIPIPVHVYTEQCGDCGMERSVEWDIDANLPLYTRDYLKRTDVIGYKIGDAVYKPEDVTIIREDYPATTLEHIKDYLKEHDPEVLDSLFYTRDDGEKEEL